MGSLMTLFTTAVALAASAPGVLANTIQLAADVPDIITYDGPPTERSTGDKLAKRTFGGVDPYVGYRCAPWYPLKPLPRNPHCWENNCWRGFINGRKGQQAFSILTKPPTALPSVAFDYCCQWASLTPGDKDFVVRNGILIHFLPWTSFCGAAPPFASDAQIGDSVAYVDDVCACTLQHKVRVQLPDEYAALNRLPVWDPTCRQHL